MLNRFVRFRFITPPAIWGKLAGHAAMPIAVGDIVELGLLRFVVERDGVVESRIPSGTQDAAASRLAEPAGASGIRADAPLASERDEEAAFDLRDLASPSDGLRNSSFMDDSFGVLDIPGAGARIDANPLSVLLGEMPAPGEAHRRRYSDALQRVANHVEPAPADTTPRSAGSGALEAAIHPALPTPTGELFDSLHEEFVRVVRDPDQLAGRTDWEGVLAKGNEQAPTLEDLSRRAMSFPLLRDILLSPTSIDQLIEHFDPLGQSGFLDDQEPGDVLRLFAPEIARNTAPPVPSLTQREHHDFSLDSHVRLGRVRPNDQEPA
jgi:hypothetical protein